MDHEVYFYFWHIFTFGRTAEVVNVLFSIITGEWLWQVVHPSKKPRLFKLETLFIFPWHVKCIICLLMLDSYWNSSGYYLNVHHLFLITLHLKRSIDKSVRSYAKASAISLHTGLHPMTTRGIGVILKKLHNNPTSGEVFSTISNHPQTALQATCRSVPVLYIRDRSLITGKGGGGNKMGKLQVQNFCPPPPPPLDKSKSLHPTNLKLFATPLQYG